jgi:hypothetical protein
MGRGSSDPLADILGGILDAAGGGQAAPQQRRRSQNPFEDFYGDSTDQDSVSPRGEIGGGSILDIIGQIIGAQGGQGGGQMPGGFPGMPGQGGGQMPGGFPGMPSDDGSGYGGIPGLPGGSGGLPGMGGSGGGILDIIGSIMGGGASGGLMGNPLLAPIINGLSRKLGLPPFIVAIGLSLLLSKLMSGASQRAQMPRQPSPRLPEGIRIPQQQPRQQQPQVQPGGGSVDLEELLRRMKQGGQQAGQDYIRGSGIDEEVAKETGLDRKQAGGLLQEILDALSGKAELPMEEQPRNTGGMKDILKDW